MFGHVLRVAPIGSISSSGLTPPMFTPSLTGSAPLLLPFSAESSTENLRSASAREIVARECHNKVVSCLQTLDLLPSPEKGAQRKRATQQQQLVLRAFALVRGITLLISVLSFSASCNSSCFFCGS